MTTGLFCFPQLIIALACVFYGLVGFASPSSSTGIVDNSHSSTRLAQWKDAEFVRDSDATTTAQKSR